MKSTGVVRRIDDLGRIVIPKELRRTLKIRDGESLEIFIDKDTILLKKFSLMDDLTEFSKKFIFSIQPFLKNNTIAVTSLDQVIASSYFEEEGKNLTESYLELLQKREMITDSFKRVEVVENGSLKSIILYPIIINSDLVGSVFFSSSDTDVKDGDLEYLQMLSRFLEKSLEQ